MKIKARNRFSCKINRPTMVAAALAWAGTQAVYADNNWDGGGGDPYDWSVGANWNGDVRPGDGGGLYFGYNGTNGTTSVDDYSLSKNELRWDTTSVSWVVNQANNAVISLYDDNGTQAKINNLSHGSVTLNTDINFAATSGQAFGEINAIGSSLTFGSGTLVVGQNSGSVVAGIRLFGSNTTTFNNTVKASGKYFALTGSNSTLAIGGVVTAGDVYVMNGGVLDLTKANVSLSSTGIRLGGDFGTTGSQDQTRGATLRLSVQTGGITNASLINAVSGNSSNALKIDSQNTSGTNALNGSIYLDNNLTVTQASNGTLQLGGMISNAGGLTFDGGGTVVLTKANTYTGDTQVNAGKLQLASGGSINNSAVRLGPTDGSTSAEVDLTSSNGGQTLSSVFNPRGTTGTGVLTIASQNTSSSNTLSGHIGFDHDLTISQAGGGTLNLTATRNASTTDTGYDLKGYTLTLAGVTNGFGSANIGLSGTLYNSNGASGGIATSGPVVVTLSGVNTYKGPTAIGASSTLKLTGGGTLGDGTGTVGIDTFGKLDVAGTAPVANAISGAGAIQVDASTTFSDTNSTYTGVADIADGITLTLSHATGSGNLFGTSTVRFGNGSTLAVSGTATLANTILDLNTGKGGLSVSGAGTVTLASNGHGNSFTYNGGTKVDGSTLKLTDNATPGNVNSTTGITLLNGATLQKSGGTGINISSPIGTSSGANGSVSVTDGGSLTLSGANTYTGGTTVGTFSTLNLVNGGTAGTGAINNSGTLTVAGNTTLANVISGSGTLSTSTYSLQTSPTVTLSGANTYSGQTSVVASTTLALTGSGAVGTGGVNVAGTLNVGNAATVNGVLSGGGTVNVAGQLTYKSANTFTGNTQIASTGTLYIGDGATAGTSAATITNNGGYIEVRGAATIDQTISGTGNFNTYTSSQVTVTAANTYTGPTNLQQSATVLTGNGRLGIGSQISLSNGASLTFNGNSQSVDGVISSYNGGNVTQAGPGKTTFTANNTYGGDTVITGGTLVAANTVNSTGSGRVSVNGGVLAGGGVAAGAVTVNSGGTITAGTGATAADGVGKLTTGAEIWKFGGSYAVKFTSSQPGAGASSYSSAGSVWDSLQMPSLDLSDLSATRQFKLVLLKAANGSFASGLPATYVIADAKTGGITASTSGTGAQRNLSNLFVLDTTQLGVDASHFSVVTDTPASGGSDQFLELSYDGGGGTQSAPEPATLALGVAAALPLAGRRRRKLA